MNLQYKNFYQYQDKIELPEKVSLTVQNSGVGSSQVPDCFVFSGPIGTSRFSLQNLNSLKKDRVAFSFDTYSSDLNVTNDKMRTIYINSTKKSNLKLYKSLLENKCVGVNRGYLINLKITGIGYRVTLVKSNNASANDILQFKLGFSHDIRYELPSGVRAFLQGPTSFSLFGLDFNQVTQIAATIKGLRKPNAYKEKGIRLLTDKVTLKIRKKLK
uniref:Ribosomal protein L6 n=1 Tax=Prototheca zopfii TaxID=3112 RepID=A0A2P1G7K7_9CHLO|nr:ribosomal protein L6 [Prototheca bovis]AVM80934.1 ribosomal protein L6 [Prototheca bovis]